jgi:hypothetical protein
MDDDNTTYTVEWYDPLTGYWMIAMDRTESITEARNKVDSLLGEARLEYEPARRVRLRTITEEYYTR